MEELEENRNYTVPSKTWTRIVGTGFDMYQESGKSLRVWVKGNSIVDVEGNEDYWRIRAHRAGTP